jgi:hypothetical protein
MAQIILLIFRSLLAQVAFQIAVVPTRTTFWGMEVALLSRHCPHLVELVDIYDAVSAAFSRTKRDVSVQQSDVCIDAVEINVRILHH